MTVAPDNWTPAADELAGKTILVTGATGGIGRAVSLACAAAGAEVLLQGRDDAALEALYDEISTLSGNTPGIVPLDLNVQEPTIYDTLRDELEAADTQLDGLIHNASVLGERRALAQTSPHSWNEVIQVNLNAQFLLTRSLMPRLEAAPSASVVLTSSGVGRKGKAYWGAYAVSKFATEGFMQVLADELGATSRIRVNSLNPGAVNTKMRRAAYPGETPNSNPAPEALSHHWVYLMSDASRHLHGQALSAQG